MKNQLSELWAEVSGFQVIIMCGLPGAGKSTLAKKISKALGAVYLSTDRIRIRELFPKTGRFDRGKVSQVEHVTLVRKKTYEELARRAILELKKNKGVILDGTFLDNLREVVIHRLMEYTDKIAIVVVKASKEKIRSRIAKKNIGLWETEVYGYWEKELLRGDASYPVSDEFVKVFEFNNDY